MLMQARVTYRFALNARGTAAYSEACTDSLSDRSSAFIDQRSVGCGLVRNPNAPFIPQGSKQPPGPSRAIAAGSSAGLATWGIAVIAGVGAALLVCVLLAAAVVHRRRKR